VVKLHTSDMEERRRQCNEVLPKGNFDVCVTTYDVRAGPAHQPPTPRM
jgi:hypothetical protein